MERVADFEGGKFLRTTFRVSLVPFPLIPGSEKLLGLGLLVIGMLCWCGSRVTLENDMMYQKDYRRFGEIENNNKKSHDKRHGKRGRVWEKRGRGLGNWEKKGR